MTDTADPSDHEAARRAKLKALRAAGDEPFKIGFERTHLLGDLTAKFGVLPSGTESKEQARVAGRVMVLRRHGKLAFRDLVEATGKIQLLGQADRLGARFESYCDLDIGDWVGAWGEVVTTKSGELSLRVEGFEVLTKSLRPWPEKFHGLKDVELRYRQRYLDLATNPRTREILEVRSKIVAVMRAFLAGRGFVEVETPMLQPLPGGALARPFVTHHNVLGMDMYLRIAPELYLKRLVVGGVEKVFEINRNFRNEGVSFKENPEFTMLELYESFADYHSMADLIEQLIKHVASEVRGSLRVPYQGSEIDLESPFRRTGIIDLAREAGVSPDGDLVAECDRLGVPHDPKWPWGKLLWEIYEKKVEPAILQPTFVMGVPKEVSPLARQHRDDPRFTEHVDLVIAGVERAVAYSELTDPDEQRARFDAQAALRKAGDEEAHVVDEDFLKALEYGMPPTGGLGLGIDRLTMILTDSGSIREVILFPPLRPEV